MALKPAIFHFTATSMSDEETVKRNPFKLDALSCSCIKRVNMHSYNSSNSTLVQTNLVAKRTTDGLNSPWCLRL